MTRIFETLSEAALEIRRDLAKGTPLTATRVQHLTGLQLDARELFSYNYAIRHVPDDIDEIINLGIDMGFEPYVEDPASLRRWALRERNARLYAKSLFTEDPTERVSPLLVSCFEGNHPSYTYSERLAGCVEMIVATIAKEPDTRRAYWTMFRPEDSMRASHPTRIPCTIGYQGMLRAVNGVKHLLWVYLQRSCDFDRFWLTDVWFASQMQARVARMLSENSEEVVPGLLYHNIVNIHSFGVSEIEIY